jgi:flavin-dependent dehydrogenase
MPSSSSVPHRHDVIVVGGGPAGSSCARDLVQAGLDVAVADRAVFPRDKPCAGWITPEVIEALGLDLDEYACGRTLQPIVGFDVGVLGGRRTPARYGAVVSHAIRRCEFDTYLLQRCGARVAQGTTIGRVDRTPDGWRVEGIGEAPMLVGAGGHFCPVARMLTPPPERANGGPGARTATDSTRRAERRNDDGSDAIVAAQELEIRLGPDAECPVAAEVPELFFCRDLRGYGWCVRKGEYLNVGFGRLDPRGLPEAARAFLEHVRARGRVPAAFPSRWIGHAYRVRARAARRVHADGVVLAGDAAGLAYPASGEGILPAIVSGQLAARAILAAAPRFTADRLASYERSLAQRFGDSAGADALLSRLPVSWVRWAGRRAFDSSWLVRHVVMPRFLHASSLGG